MTAPEIDFDFFPGPVILESDQMIIWESGLTSLEEKLADLHLRAKYHGEWTHNQISFLELIEDLQARVTTIRRTGTNG